MLTDYRGAAWFLSTPKRLRVTLKTINAEPLRRVHTARLEKGTGYFYFHLGDAVGWLDRTVQVPKVSSLTLEKWLAEYERL